MIDLDVHAHLAPINPPRLAQLQGVAWSEQSQELVLDGRRIGMKDLFHPRRLIDWMDQHQIQRALISIPPPLYRQKLDSSAALQWANYVNQELLSIAHQYNARFGALFYIPLEHPGLIPMLTQEYLDNQYAGIALAAGGHPGIIYSQPAYQPLWEALDQKKNFVFIHPGACADPRLSVFYLENLLGNPYETGVAAAHLIMANVPSRYSNIQFCLAHAGGVLPCICGRLERGFLTRRPGIDADHTETPLQAARRFYTDDIAHDDSALALAKSIFGADHILYGSDWPFPMGRPQPPQKAT